MDQVLAENDESNSENRSTLEPREQSPVNPLRLCNEDVDEIGDSDNEEDTYDRDEVEEGT